MPNWCNNTIIFENDVEDNFQLIDSFRQPNPFHLIRPCPQELYANEAHIYGGKNAKQQDLLRDQLTRTYGYPNAYDWHVANWGTKWDAHAIDSDGLTFYFDTAWAPPLALYQYIAKHHPGARFDFSYEEGGCDFAGEGYVRDGEFNEYDVPGSWSIEPKPSATSESVVIGSETRLRLP